MEEEEKGEKTALNALHKVKTHDDRLLQLFTSFPIYLAMNNKQRSERGR